jgi:uncharacterized RDD family membrane protein YckC
MSTTAQYAGFWRRAVAHLIDMAIYVPVAMAVLYGVYGPEYFAEQGTPFQGFWDVVIQELLPLVLVVWLWHRYGATPGKQMMQLRIIDAHTGERLSWAKATLRYFAYIVSLLPLGLGFLWIAWDRRKQGFHDKIARSLVIYVPEDDAEKSLDELMKGSQ